MILIADSGSTKTDWCIVNKGNPIFFETQGLNPFFTATEIIPGIISQSFPSEIKTTQISHCYFYGSGCKSEQMQLKVKKALLELFPHANIEIQGDLFGAGLASYGDTKGNVCILGTGMSMGFWNGTCISEYANSLGYILGDEGSGAYLGKMLIKSIFENTLSKETIQTFNTIYSFSLQDILERVYKGESPNQFLADFTRFLYTHKESADIKQLILHCFSEFAEKAYILSEQTKNNKFSFIGSIAHYFEEELRTCLQKKNIVITSIISKPILAIQSQVQSKL